MPADRDRLRSYYATHPEADRLNSDDGWFERVRTLELVEQHIPPGSRVLDLGGGAGVYAVPLAEQGHRVTLVDLSPVLVDQARSAFEAAGVKAEALRVGDAADLALDGPFDAVLCCGPLYHAADEDDLKRMLGTCAHLLRDGGVLLGAFIPRVTGVSGLLARAQHPDQIVDGTLEHVWRTGRFENAATHGFSEGFFVDPPRIARAVEQAGFSGVHTISLRGLAAPYGKDLAQVRDANPAVYAEARDLVRETAGRSDVVGMAWHAMVIGTRSSGPSWRWKPWADLSGDEVHDLLRLRQEVFVVEQDCAYLDADGLDPRAWHLLGFDADGLIAYLRGFGPGVTRDEAVIGRVITAPRARGTGLGRTLMDVGREHVEQTFGEGPIWLGGQAHLRRFYESLGYAVCGPGYDEDGIPHLPMRRA